MAEVENKSLLNIDDLKNSFNSVKNSITDTSVNAANNIKNMVNNTNDTTIIIGLIIVILVAAIISYTIYYIISNNLFKNVKYIVPKTKVPVFANQKSVIPINIPITENGQRRTYTFWMYINDMNKYSGLYKHVLHVANATNDTITSASPYIFLDKTQNKLYVRFGINTPSSSSTDSMNGATLLSVSNISDNQLLNYMKQGIIIPYIPLQRWVHIAIVINTTVSGSTITCYVDGDLSISNSDRADFNITDVLKEKVNYQNLSIDQTGNLIIGGSSFDGNGNGFSGLVSKFTTYNYDLNQYDIYKDYNEGPVDNLLAKLGLGMYGVRNPIYKL